MDLNIDSETLQDSVLEEGKSFYIKEALTHQVILQTSKIEYHSEISSHTLHGYIKTINKRCYN